jgi:acyl carrier protein
MATVTPTAPPGTTWTEDTITELVIELLADLLDEDRDRLAHDLRERGSMMPVDSLDLMDILVEFRQHSGLRIPKKKLRRRDMRSVRAFARFAAREARP